MKYYQCTHCDEIVKERCPWFIAVVDVDGVVTGRCREEQ